MGLLQTVALGVLLGLGGYWVAGFGINQPPGLRRELAAATLCWAWATLGVVLLGSFGVLRIEMLLAWTLAGALGGFGLRMRNRLRGGRSEATKLEVVPATLTASVRWGVPATLAVGLVLWPAALLGAASFIFPVKVVSDGPIYHLYFAVRWWQAGKLALVATPFGETAAPYFPANGDAWFTWLTVAWGGDRLARVGQVPFLILAALAAFGIARRLGAGLTAASVAACWFVTSTPLFLFTFEPNVDTIFVAGYLVAAYFLLLYALGDGGADCLFIAGLAAGGALGTKPTGVVFVPPLLGLGVIAVLCRRAHACGKLLHLFVLCASPLLLAGYWYARNFWLTGNPLYPLRVAAFGRTWLEGWYGAGAMQLSPYYLPVTDWRAGADILLALLDPRLAPVWLLAILLGGLLVRRREGGPERLGRWVTLCGLLAVANVALYWFLVPYRTQQRFMLQALGLAAVPLAVVIDRAGVLRWLACGLLALHLLTLQAWPFAGRDAQIPWDLSPHVPNAVAALVPLPLDREGWTTTLSNQARASSLWRTLEVGFAALLAALAWYISTRWGAGFLRFRRAKPLQVRGKTSDVAATEAPTQRKSKVLVSIAFAATVAPFLVAGLLLYPWGIPARLLFYPMFPDYYRGWLALDRLTAGHPARVAYAGTDLPYYLFGPDLRNEVRSINVDGHRGWLMHDYHRQAIAAGHPTWPTPRPGWDRIEPDYEAWLANLHAEAIQYLFVTRANPAEGLYNLADPEGFPIERVWADAHPDVFDTVYGAKEGDPQVRVYRVR